MLGVDYRGCAEGSDITDFYVELNTKMFLTKQGSHEVHLCAEIPVMCQSLINPNPFQRLNPYFWHDIDHDCILSWVYIHARQAPEFWNIFVPLASG